MTDRRQFLKQSALVSLTPLVPAFLQQTVRADSAHVEERILVVVQLDGGNDGLNTVIPFRDEQYSKLRPTLQVDRNDAIKVNDDIALHPAMKPAAELLEDGRFSIIQGVGYPNPNRSHFESMAIWHHARRESANHDSIGWLGRAMDTRPSGQTDSIFVGDAPLPVALLGRRSQATAMARESDMQLVLDIDKQPQTASDGSLASFVSRTLNESYLAARRFSEAGVPGDDANYPFSDLADQLKLVSRLIKLGGAARVYYVSQSGYDTHASQSRQHRDLLDDLADALKAFLDDLKFSNLDDRVVMMCFSEFGRRAKENASAGTDHGAAGPVFLAGAPVKQGVIGSHPSLSDLASGDLKHGIDFRAVYATLLQQWLGIHAAKILNGRFAAVDCLA